ncbi:putative exopolygalacturonase [Kosakonia phage Kc263]|uniref:Exopolygalacturonase n=1 Tax=Kosakonia phage Kc263 TaxID=2863194 RepID=A0AAE7WFF7_9CAUD|nr:putative exopolygalacturonase [Kosakonia phage Kc263]QYN80087.1 putative exopolygalacturonase [Kosakonia phage Kc263]
MKPINFLYAALVTIVIVVILQFTNKAEATTTMQAPRADHAGVQADKVMNGITDITVNMLNSKTNTHERVLLQCDSTTQSLNVFYYMNDVLGGKAKGATQFRIAVYGNGEDGYHAGGDGTIFDGGNMNDNLRDKLQAMQILDGKGFLSFEFYTVKDGKEIPVASSMLVPSYLAKQILQAVDNIAGSEGCNIDGGFTTVYPLKNLTDQI